MSPNPPQDFWQVIEALRQLTGTERFRSHVGFRAATGLGFPTSDVTAVQSAPRPDGTYEHEVSTTFLGLVGADSPLPGYLLEALVAEDGEGRRPLVALLDVFHNRLVHALIEIADGFEPASPSAERAWIGRLGAASGTDEATSAAVKDVGDWRIARLAPILANGWRSAWAIETALRDTLGPKLPQGASLDVKEFTGGWSAIHPDDLCFVGVQNATLGVQAVLGEVVPDVAGRFTVEVGEVPERSIHDFGAEGQFGRLLDCVVLLLLDEPVECELRLRVREDRHEAIQLGGPSRHMVGYDAWLGGVDARRRIIRRQVPGGPGGGPSQWTTVAEL